MNLTIKQVKPDHLDFLTLVSELNDFFNAKWGDAAESYAHHHNLAEMKAAFVAYADDKPIGCGAWKLLSDGRPEVKRMYVREEYRKHGVAVLILATIEKSIQTENYQAIVLETGAEMMGAINFYQKNGYQLIPNYGDFINDERCVCLEKILIK